MCRWGGGGARSLKGGGREGKIPRDLAPGGGEITGGEIPGTPALDVLSSNLKRTRRLFEKCRV